MSRPRVRFGAFEFDPTTGELRRDGARVRLQRQPARLLGLLLTRPGELVTRDEIRRTLWGDDVHVDFERSLNFCVRKLRAAFEDDASAPRFVETVPTRGYRFIPATAATEHTEHTERTEYTPATEHTEHTERTEYTSATEHTEHTERTEYTSATEHTEHTEHTEGTKHRLYAGGALMWAVISALLLGAGAGFAVALYRPGASAPPKVVVVPFHNETGSADFDRVAKGVSDAAVARLAAPERLQRLRVIGNATDVFFSFRPRDLKAMGQALDARYLVLGQLKKDNARFRLVAHLIRVSDQTHVWATTFDRDSLDLSVQAAIAEDIARAVSAHLPS